ncbi:MAG TPA: yfeABCD locus regulator [Sedimenticola thiotaurini]|uniref:YfeABCD locus regulator n=1 Tax=Sedimenticola thiotaurini TaxID=1543721 RepID=A0A831WB24_9GAMM|nr:yfeABCD locus regulator [Sedimenticola thiotaurini]
MNYQQAKNKVVIKRILGAGIGVPAFISTVVSLLKMIYFRIDDGTELGGMIARPLKTLVSWAYENSHQFIGWFWEYSPTPDQMNLVKSGNGYFLFIYLLIFIGAAFFVSGNKLARRLQKINQKIENQFIEESIKGEEARSREEIERETEIPKSSIFSQFHQLYLAPIVVGLVVALLLKFMGAI